MDITSILDGMADKNANVAEIHVVNNSTGPSVKVLVPKGTTLEEAFKLRSVISGITRGLNGCEACAASGTPVEFIERSDLSEIVRIDLATMEPI
jgi:hypothetical protein